ncbi:hypothetical protein Q7P37_008167 [Cladosporium fusiforme]
MTESNEAAAPDPVPETSEPKSSTPHSNRTGWDGKLRVNSEKQAVLANPEALEDSDYEDEDAPPVDEIAADEDLLDEEDPETEEIDAQHSRVASIPSLRLERFKNLRKLCLRQNSVQKIELPPSLAPQLVELELYDNLIKHLEGLEECTSLTSLDLSYNKLKHIKHLSTLTNLDHVYFVQNRISRIENLETLTKLTYLELGANRIREIEGIDTLTNLTSLWLGQNRITELKNLSTLTNLRTLSIQANRLASLDGIETLPQLTELYLEILDFQSNPISSLAGLEELKALENVWASNCEVADFREIERALRDKEKLEEVYFEGNPVQKREPVLYRNKLRLALPQVGKIDASYVRAN